MHDDLSIENHNIAVRRERADFLRAHREGLINELAGKLINMLGKRFTSARVIGEIELYRPTLEAIERELQALNT